MEVYSPREDSFLLVDCILSEDLSGKDCLDMGCGSGVESVALIRVNAKSVLAVDINEDALKETKKRVESFFPKKNLGFFKVKESNLFDSVNGKFDFIAFNPPYVPTSEIKWVDLDGGVRGREVIDVFISKVGSYLNKNGVLLLLISSLNCEEEVVSLLKENGFVVSVVARKNCFLKS